MVGYGRLARVWMGDADLVGASRSGAIQLTGPSQLRRAFRGWLRMSVLAGVGLP